MHIKVKDLHPTLIRALESVKYYKGDINVEGKETASLLVGGGAGRRGFAILVDMENDRFEPHMGSWGGANMFNPNNPVDLDSKSYPLPPNGAVITGSIGGSTHATIDVHPSLIPRMLPKSEELTEQEKWVLYCHKSLKGGEYRREELKRKRATERDIESMVVRGFLKQNKAGSRQITTEGKNALGDYRGY